MSRPRFSPEIARIAAEEIVSELIRCGHIDEVGRAESVDDIVEHGKQHDDGYELAQALDNYAHWSCNFAMSEILDGFSWVCAAAIAAAQKKWAIDSDQKPPFTVGTRVNFGHGEAGVIDCVYEHGAAQYCIKVDSDEQADGPIQRRRIVNFEDLTVEGVAVA